MAEFETVTIFRSFVEVAEGLKSDAERGKLYHAVCRYSLYGEEPDGLDGFLQSLFALMKPSIDKSNKRRSAQQTSSQRRSQNGLQKGLQTPPNDGLQNDLQNDLQKPSHDASQNSSQTTPTRPRLAVAVAGKKTGSKEPAKENLSFVGMIPANLQDEAFRKSWLDWEAARREQKKKLTPKAAQGQLELLAAYPVKDAVEMLKTSIRNGWQGIFPLDNQPRKPSNEPKNYNGI